MSLICTVVEVRGKITDGAVRVVNFAGVEFTPDSYLVEYRESGVIVVLFGADENGNRINSSYHAPHYPLIAEQVRSYANTFVRRGPESAQ